MQVTQVLLNPADQVAKWVNQATAIADEANLDPSDRAVLLPEIVRLLAHGAIVTQQPASLDLGPLGNGLKLRR